MANANGSRDLVVVDEPVVSGEMLDDLINKVQENESRRREPTANEKTRAAISAVLKELGKMTVQDDTLVFEGSKFVLPRQYEGNLRAAIKTLAEYAEQQRQPFVIRKTFNYRPYDGAYAFMEVMRAFTGTAGIGVTKWTIFGPEHPEFRTINTGPGETAQVPWGTIAFPSFEAEFEVGQVRDPEKGLLSHITCTVPRRWRQEIEGIFTLIERHLKEHSIYRFKAINGAENPEFLNLNLDPSDVVYSEDVDEQLNANVWTPIEYADTFREIGMPLKRAVLFSGPYGTGKSLGCTITFQKAVKHGWTALMCRTGIDDPAEVLRTAELYAPAVVVIEDIDIHTDGGSKVDISRTLDMLDGIVNKGVEILALFTTNHLGRIQKGCLRPGRIDAVIQIEGLDEPGFRRLVTKKVKAKFLADDVDWAAVAKAFEGFLPAFVSEAAERAQRYTMSRNAGRPGMITTKDLVHAAEATRPQLLLMDQANEGAYTPTINDAFRAIAEDVVKRTRNPKIGAMEVEPATILNGGKAN